MTDEIKHCICVRASTRCFDNPARYSHALTLGIEIRQAVLGYVHDGGWIAVHEAAVTKGAATGT